MGNFIAIFDGANLMPAKQTPGQRKALRSAAAKKGSLRRKTPAQSESGWVIEGAWSDPSDPVYWAGSSLWMADHMCAIRFARRHDAEQAAAAMLDGMNIRICEHIWMGRIIREPVLTGDIRQSVSRREALARLQVLGQEIETPPTNEMGAEARSAEPVQSPSQAIASKLNSENLKPREGMDPNLWPKITAWIRKLVGR